ncbi:MAG: hypothetical protein GHCLOJNM_03653 [bacterium]|nr:hypothetical protein [bacterium]
MSSAIYARILEETRGLSCEELDELIQALEERKIHLGSSLAERPRWKDLRGSAPYPLCGEDAQEWVTRTRRESDERREIR